MHGCVVTCNQPLHLAPGWEISKEIRLEDQDSPNVRQAGGEQCVSV